MSGQHTWIITGDLNFQLDDPTNINVRRFSGQLDAHGLIQHVTGATHTGGHTLDVVITRDISCIIHKMPSIAEPCLYDTKGNRSGDHLGIYVTLDYTKPQDIKKGHRNIDHSQCTSGTTDDLVDAYNSGHQGIN